MNDPMHIVHTEASSGWGGQEIRILTEAGGLQARGHRLTILANAGAPILDRARTMGLEAVALPLQKKGLAALRALRGWLRTQRPDVVNTHSSIDAWMVAMARIGLRPRIPVVRTRHISAPVSRTMTSRWVYLNGADRVVTTGERLREDLLARLGGDPAHFVSVPTGIDLQRFSRAGTPPRSAALAALGVPPGRTVIGIAATLRSWKGHLVLIDAFDRLAERNPDLTLLIVGDGPMRELIAQRRDASPHAAEIHLLGHRHDVEQVLAAMDIFCLPSYANEGVPQAILQAMAMELPVVSTDVGAILEVVHDGETGVLAAARDPVSLAERIQWLLDNREDAHTLGQNAHRLVTARHGTAQMCGSMERLFRTACDASPPDRGLGVGWR